MHSSFFGAFRLVAERFIRHIVGCCLLFVLIINFSLCQKANCVLFVSGGVVGEFDRDRSYCSKEDYYPAVRMGSSNTRFFPQFFLFFLVVTCPSSWFLLGQTDIGHKLPLNISIVRSFTVASPKFS